MRKASASSKIRPAPLSVRFSEAEKTLLRSRAGNQPLGGYIREAVLGGEAERRQARRAPVRDGEPLGRLLALLGQSRMASNLNQIAKAAHQGSLPVTEKVETDLRRACAEVAEMRLLLLQALGLRLPEEAAPPLAQEFAEAAGGSSR